MGWRVHAWVLTGNHYQTLMDYLHFYSVWAGLVRPEASEGVLDYP